MLIVSAHPYCTCKYIWHTSEVINAMPGLNNPGQLVTPSFLLMDHFLYRFSMFRQKMKKSVDENFEFFAKCTIEFHSF